MSENKSVSKNTKSSGKSMAIATFLVMLGLVFSRCSGFLREILVGNKFSDIYRDSFTLAFTIPDLVYNLLIGGSIQAAITPALSSYISKGEEKRGIRAVSIFISVFVSLLVIVCVIGVVFSEPIYQLYNSGDANPEKIRLAAMASKWLFPQIVFMTFAALCIGVLNAYKRFSSTAFGPTIYNIFVLLSIVVFAGSTEHKLMLTTCGVMFAALVYFLFQFFIGFDKLKQFRFVFSLKDPDFIDLVKRALPILISASVVQINMVILNFFATSLPDGDYVYLLRNASTTWQLPYGIFAVAVGNVMLPSLAALYSSNKFEEASELLSSRLKTALFLTIPSAAFMYVLNTDVIKAIFQWSERYTDADATHAGKFLMGYTIAIITHTVVFIMNQAFYAIGKTKVPLIAGSIGLVTNPLLCMFFISQNMGLLSLTLAYSLTSVIQMSVLCIIYNRDERLKPRKIFGFLIKSGICVVLMILVIAVLDYYFPGHGTKITQLGIIAFKGVVSVIVYFVAAFILKMPEARVWIEKYAGKFLKKSH